MDEISVQEPLGMSNTPSVDTAVGSDFNVAVELNLVQ